MPSQQPPALGAQTPSWEGSYEATQGPWQVQEQMVGYPETMLQSAKNRDHIK